MSGSIRAEDTLLDSPYLKRLWNASSGALALCEPGGAVIKVNRKFAELFRFSEDECRGRDLDSLITPAHFIAEADSTRRLVQSGTPLAFTTWRKTVAGQLLQTFLAASVLEADNGGKYLFFIFREVPEGSRKRSSDLAEDSKSLETAFENSCEPSLVTDAGGRVLKSNPTFTAEFGWRPEDIKNRDVRDVLIPGTIHPEADYITAMASAGRILRLETDRMTADGSTRNVSLICKPMENGNVFRVFRTRDSRAMAETGILGRNRFRGCPESGNRSGMLYQCRTDRQRTMEFVAPGTAAFTGYSEEQMLSGETSLGAAILEIDREMVLKSIQDSLVSGTEYSITYRIRKKEGSILWVMEQGRAFKADRDSVDFCEGCVIDITGTRQQMDPDDGARERIERLHTVAGELQRSRSVGEIYRICAEAGLSILNGVCSCIFLQDGDEMRIAASAGREELPCRDGCSLGMAEVALNSSGPCYFRSNDRSDGFCPAGTNGVCFRLGKKAVFQVMSRGRNMFGNVDSRILELLLGYTEQGLKRITLQHQLINQALHDPLTGIYNRNYFNRLIQLEENRARKLDSAISFIMVDVDDFKSINDRFGHQVGDRVLQEVAKVLEGALRKTDTVLRYGGDEFLIILTRMNRDYTHIVEERINASMEKAMAPEELADEKITVSMGHAFWTPDNRETIDEILKVADMIMLSNKKKRS